MISYDVMVKIMTSQKLDSCINVFFLIFYYFNFLECENSNYMFSTSGRSIFVCAFRTHGGIEWVCHVDCCDIVEMLAILY